jgi:ABC-type dipeptide/oligopeptide/nickel transport system ATPase component
VANTSSGLSIGADERVALVGTTGSGKTTLALVLLQYTNRLIVLDPKGNMSRAQKPEWRLDEWSEKAADQLAEGGGTVDKPLRLRIALPVGEEDWEPILRRLMQLRNVIIYVDEISGVAPTHVAKPFFKALYTRGREFGLGTWGAMQRPSGVPLVTLTESNWYYLFRTKLEADRERMAEFMGPKALIVPPDKYGCWYMNDQWPEPRYSPGLVSIQPVAAGSEKGGARARL